MTRTIHRFAAAIVAAFACLAFAGAAHAAAPQPELWMTHVAQPTHWAPGSMSTVAVTVKNHGELATSEPLELTLELPPGTTGMFAFDTSGLWDCPTVAGATTVQCTTNPGVSIEPHHFTWELVVFVDVPAGASGSGATTATLSGGGDPTSTSSTASYVIDDEPAQFGIVKFAGWALNRDGSIASQAGGHPDVTTEIQLSTKELNTLASPVDNQKEIVVDLPPGLIGDPTVGPKCSTADVSDGNGAQCAAETQVGTVDLFSNAGLPWPTTAYDLALYNVDPPPGVPARFAFNLSGTVTSIDPVVSAESGYAVKAKVSNISQTLATFGSRVTLWGVPQDPIHDLSRWDVVPTTGEQTSNHPSRALRRAFVTAPTSCTGAALETRMSVVSWQEPGMMHTASFDIDFNGDPIVNEGCDRLAFDPSVDVRPTSSQADSPSGLDVSIENPQNLGNPGGLANAQLEDVKVSLPEGVSVNPSSATGLEACSDAQLGLGNDEPISCPLGSKLGSAVARTPLLEEPLEGGVYLRPQASDDPESGDMFRLALVIDNPERGILVKLAGSARADADTGRLTASFDDNPQLPVESIDVRLKSGPRAPLATPAACGPKSIGVGLASWAGHDVDLSSGFDVDCPGLGGFGPSFVAGSVSPTGGSASPFVVRISRDDRQQYIDGVEVDLPQGVLAKLAGVALCGDAAANAGTCGGGSRVGSATVAAGPGSNPFYLEDQPVYLAGPYKGAPYSLSVAARAVAGPFDLGMVVVRQALHVDPETAQVKVVSDPLPTIVKGVPLRMRSIDVSIDRPDFTRNPTSCAVKQVGVRLHSQQGSSHSGLARFQASDCQSLAFRPKLAMRLTGKGQTRTGKHPGLKAVLTQGKGQANVAAAKVTLPKSVVLDANNSYDPQLVCDYDRSLKADCPQSTVIGKATANTPLLGKPLSGQVHLVQGIKFGAKGNRIRTTPSLLVKLRGEVDINLRARTTTEKGTNRLVTTFPQVPDAQVSKFTMQINGGRKGILVVTRTRKAKIDICRAPQTAAIQTNGHNGKHADYNTTIKTPCNTKATKTKAKPRHAGRSRR